MIAMDDEVNIITLELRGALVKLKAEVDTLRTVASSTGTNAEQNLETYHSTVLPQLLKLRGLNRLSKDKLEAKYAKVKHLNRVLVTWQDSCENIAYKASCLNHEVSNAKRRLRPAKSRSIEAQGDLANNPEINGHGDTNFFDSDRVAELDHKTRLAKLDEEEKKRRELQDKLAVVTAETNEMDALSKSSEEQLNRIKPFIKQLIDRVDSGEGT